MPKYTDDHDKPCDEMRLLPYGGGGNLIVGYQSYRKEIAFREERIKSGVPFELPKWEDLEVYAS
jgi:hypothetical protein